MSCNTSRRLAVAAVLAGLVSLGAVCESLFGKDTRPPSCRVVQPADSAAVSGLVTLRADAADSSGVKAVEFYVNGALVGTATAPPYAATWDASGQPDESWHRIHCLASDVYDNVGGSDTISVQVVPGGQRGIFHGAFELNQNYYWRAGFAAVPGDTLAGSFRVLAGRALSRFIWLDAANFRKFGAGEAYTPLLERLDLAELTVREPVAAADSFYLVFLNTDAARVEVWARFTLE